MAETAPAAGTVSPSSKTNVLGDLGFEAVSPGISVYDPSSSSSSHDTVPNGTADAPKQASSNSDNDTPELIIICSWAFAQPRHISKYIIGHQSLYPHARILLIQNIIANAIWRPDAWQMPWFEPAARIVQDYVNSLYTASPPREPKVLLHIFSNGGSHAAVQLAQACRQCCGGFKLPVTAMVLDSCPGQPRFMETINALVLGVPSKNVLLKAVGAVAAVASVSTTAVLDVLGISELAAWKLWKTLNDPYGPFLLKNAYDAGGVIPRTYIYGPGDTMILVEDVEEHARIGRERAIVHGEERDAADTAIVLEKFEGTAHVNHVKLEKERYWEVIERAWRRTEHS